VEEMKLIVATTNPGKLEEIRRIIEPCGVEIVPPPEKVEVEESGTTFLENAYLKARAYYERFGMPVLADDSGLVVDALGGYPGIFSSRFCEIEFGGYEPCKGNRDGANVRKLLRLMEGKEDRRARFVAFVVVLGKEWGVFSEGVCEGSISFRPRGEGGFGYDPVFIPKGEHRTMAELAPEEKDALSHRGKALRKLLEGGVLGRILEGV